MTKETLIEQLRETLPVVWDRKNTTQLTGGLVHHRTLANLMSLDKGPKGTFRMGHKKVGVTREAFLEWLEPQLDFAEEG